MWNGRAVATSMVGPVSTGPLFEATTTFLPINIHKFRHVPSRPVYGHMATVDRVEIDGCK